MADIIKADCSTGDIEIREMNTDEQRLHDSMIADSLEFEKKLVQEQSNKESALAKLQALGLTEEEVKALLG